ncbi:hypothetical protein SLE2022_093390 [Rubroshorea leprosula]
MDLSTKEVVSLVVVIGKNAFATLLQRVRLFVSPLDGLTTVGIGHVIYQQVYDDVQCEDDSLTLPAMEADKVADTTILSQDKTNISWLSNSIGQAVNSMKCRKSHV